MPKAGYESVTVKETIMAQFHGVFNKHSEELRHYGINSFSGFMCALLYTTTPDCDDGYRKLIQSYVKEIKFDSKR